MDRSPVRSARHHAIEYVELAHEMALAHAANRGIARHLTNVFGTEGKQPNARAAPGSRSRSLAPGMAGADHQNIMHKSNLSGSVFHVKHRSLSETEAREERIQNVLNTRASGQPIESTPGAAKVLRQENDVFGSRRFP
jgi:hypothetical protein